MIHSKDGSYDRLGIHQIVEYELGARVAQVSGVGRSGCHGDNPRAATDPGGDIKRRVSNQDSRSGVEDCAALGLSAFPREYDQLGAVGVVHAVGTDVKVEMACWTEGGDLEFGYWTHVAGQHRLTCPGGAGKSFEYRCRAIQRTTIAGDHLHPCQVLRRDSGTDRFYSRPGGGYVVQGECVGNDRPVSPAGRVREVLKWPVAYWNPAETASRPTCGTATSV
jgi:hypothetical protein